MTPFNSFLLQFKFLTFEEVGLLIKHAKIKRWKNGENIHEPGKIQRYPGLLLSGLARMYYQDIDGNRKTIWLADKTSILADPISALDKIQSETGIQAIKDCIVVHFNDDELNKLQLEYPGLMRFKIQHMELGIRELYQRLLFFSTMTPEQRYEDLLNHKPHLIKHVPQKYLASYIGVTEVSLSRIKKRFKK